MPSDSSELHVVLDASVLINFLAVDRADALLALQGHRFIITDHVRAEVTSRFPAQLARLSSVIDEALLEVVSVTDKAELETFARLTAQGLGVGECASIALAHHRGWHLAADDKVARKRATRLNSAIILHDTQSFTVCLIRVGSISVEDADAMLEAWRSKYRFKIGSFNELLVDP
jgi:predicted nucleic acid-binding protein